MSVFSGVFRNRVHTLTVTQRLLLPQANTPTAPSLAFGDGGEGFYLIADNRLGVAISGTGTFEFDTDEFKSRSSVRGPSMINVSSSATVPVHVFANDTNTGSGSPAADQVSMIAGGVEGVRVSEAGGAINVDIKGDMNIVSNENIVVCNDNEVVFNY